MQKILSNNSTVIFVIILLLVLFGPSINRYINSKSMPGYESMSKTNNSAYNGGNGQSQNSNVVPSEPLGQNEVFSSVNGIQTTTPGAPSSCSKPNTQNPADLLPKDTNGQWAQLNPSGKGDLSNINLLKAGYHIGIDTIGQTLRNPNLQIRSEPANPQINIGPWNQSTITPDFMRVPFEIGTGSQ